MPARVKKDDIVFVIAGDQKGARGKVLRVQLDAAPVGLLTTPTARGNRGRGSLAAGSKRPSFWSLSTS